jgi:hypothetical protein
MIRRASMAHIYQDKIYKCLNPVGIQDAVDLYPLAPRLDRIDGKTIYFSLGAGGEQEILIPLRKRLQSDYPNVNWKMVAAGRGLSDEELKTAAAVIRGVVW